MDLRGLVVGAGNVAQGYRATEAALRQAEEERLNLQQLRMAQAEREREEQFRRTMPRSELGDTAPLPGAPLPSRPELRLPPAAPLQEPRVVTPPAAPAAGVRPDLWETRGPGEGDVPYQPAAPQMYVGPAPAVVTPLQPSAAVDPGVLNRAQQNFQMMALRLRDAQVGLTNLQRAGASPSRLAQQQRLIDRETEQLAAARQGLERITSSGQAAPAASAAPTVAPAAPAIAPAAQQYDSRKTQYDALMQQAAQANGIDPVVFKRLIGTESSFDPNAVSPRGANFGLGIAQIAAVHGLSDEQRRDPNVAIPFAAQLFKQYLDAAGGDYNQAILRYKGASSPTGVQAMAPVAQTILSGVTPTTAAALPAAAPAAAAPPAAAAAAPAAAAGPMATALQPPAGVREEMSDEDVSRYYSVNPNALMADERYLDEDYGTQRSIAVDDYTAQKANLDATYRSVRQQLVAEYNTRFNAGQARQAQEVVARIQQLDEQYRSNTVQLGTATRTALSGLDSKYRLSRLALATFSAVAQLEWQNNPTAAAQMMSYLYGQPMQFRGTSDGRFDMLMPDLQGRLQVRGTFSRQQIADALKTAGVAAYRDAKAASAEKVALERVKTEGKVSEQQAQMIRELAGEAMRGRARLAEITLQGQQYKVQGDGNGGVVIYRQDGQQVGIIDPRANQTVAGPDGTPIPAAPVIRWTAPR